MPYFKLSFYVMLMKESIVNILCFQLCLLCTLNAVSMAEVDLSKAV